MSITYRFKDLCLRHFITLSYSKNIKKSKPISIEQCKALFIQKLIWLKIDKSEIHETKHGIYFFNKIKKGQSMNHPINSIDKGWIEINNSKDKLTYKVSYTKSALSVLSLTTLLFLIMSIVDIPLLLRFIPFVWIGGLNFIILKIQQRRIAKLFKLLVINGYDKYKGIYYPRSYQFGRRVGFFLAKIFSLFCYLKQPLKHHEK